MTTFSIDIIMHAGEEEVHEDQVLAHFESAPGDFGEFGDAAGPVNFVIGGEKLRFEDTVSYLLTTLATETVPDLVAEGQAGLSLYSSPISLKFSSDGTTVTMTSAHLGESYTFAQADFIAQSMDACRRFLTLSETIWPDAEDARADIRALLAETEEELAG
jgi:hypothetical protein